MSGQLEMSSATQPGGKSAAVSPRLLALAFQLNGQPRTVSIPAEMTLLLLLREHMGLPGTKIGCGHGQCGACTVLIDGERHVSCLKLAATLEGAAVTTIEGLAGPDGDLHPMQEAFLRREAYQCGYCTPGQIMSAVGLLAEGIARTHEEVAEAMSGNLCRCGAYPHIVEAVMEVIAARHAEARP